MDHVSLRTVGVSALLTSLLLVAGCGSESGTEPVAGDTTPAGAPGPSDPTEPSTPAAPSFPTGLPVPAKEGPRAYLERFHAELLGMQASGDTAAFRATYTDCPSCDALAREVEEVYADGGQVLPGPAVVSDVTMVAGDDDIDIYQFGVQAEPGEVRDAAGETQQVVPGGWRYYEALLVRGDDAAWEVQRFRRLTE